MRLSKNFKLKEFIESRFYNKNVQNKVWYEFYKQQNVLLPNIQKLANQLQHVRDYLNAPVHINIGYRPLFYELTKGRSGKSQHVLGKASDIYVKNMNVKDLHKTILKLIKERKILEGGVGLYLDKNFVHYDIRGYKARW